MNIIVKWIFKPAKWYQFWLPASGCVGGSILGVTICLILTLLFWGFK